nr:TonB-dependent receptor [uncultured Dyadobacter sp.]
MKRTLFTLLLSALTAPALLAQKDIHGYVFDKDTGLPIAEASVLAGSKRAGSKTDLSGRFRIASLGADSLFVSSVSYKGQKFAVKGDTLHVFLQQEVTGLQEVVISGNRELQARTETPLAIHSISKLTINDTKATRLDMLLNKVPGVFMVDLGNEQHSMSMRQPLGYNNLYLYLQDGVPVRTVGDFNHNALIEINQAAVGRVEVIKGPASSLYGSEAVGGAVNFITPSPSWKPSGKIQVEAGSRGYKRTDFFASNTFGKLGLYVGGYYVNQNQAERLHNDFRKLALTFRADYTFNEKNKLTFTGDYIDYQTDQVGGLDSAHFYGKDYESRYRFTYRKVNALRFKASLDHFWDESNKTTVTLFHRNTSIGQNPFYRIAMAAGSATRANGQINEDAFNSYGAIVQHRKNFNFLNAKWITGASLDFSPATYVANYIRVNVDGSRIFNSYESTDSLLTNYKVDLFNSALYTQFEFNPLEKLKIVAAARYDRMDYKFDNLLPAGSFSGAADATNHFSYFTPKLGLTYSFTGQTGVYANYSVGFAPPNITDLFTGVQVPTLKPSTYNNYEIGGWVNFHEGRGNVELTVYQLNGNNEIVNVRLPDGTYQNQNAGETTHAGVEVNFRYNFAGGLSVRAGGTYAQHKYKQYVQQENVYSGNQMSQAPPHIVNSEMTYKPLFFKGFRIALEWQSLGSYYTDPRNTEKYKGFNVFNARAGYQYKGVEFWVNCLNIANTTYATTVEKSVWGTTYRPGQLRSINVGVAYRIN